MEGEERGEGERACTHSHTRVYILIHRTQKTTLWNILSNIVCTVCASLSVYLCLMFFSYPLVGLMVRISKSLYTHWSWPSKEFYLTIAGAWLEIIVLISCNWLQASYFGA